MLSDSLFSGAGASNDEIGSYFEGLLKMWKIEAGILPLNSSIKRLLSPKQRPEGNGCGIHSLFFHILMMNNPEDVFKERFTFNENKVNLLRAEIFEKMLNPQSKNFNFKFVWNIFPAC